MRRFGVDLDDRANDVLKLCQRRTAGGNRRFDMLDHFTEWASRIANRIASLESK